MTKSKVSSIFFIVSIVLAAVSSILTALTFRDMLPLHAENNAGKLYMSIDDVEKLSYTFLPNISATTIPLDALKARYFLKEGKTKEGLALLWNSVEDNPYLKFNETVLAIHYSQNLKVDSALYYADDAYLTLPKNPLHAQLYIAAHSLTGDTLAMQNAFHDIIQFYPQKKEVWFNYLEGHVNLSKGRNDSLVALLNKAIKLFPEDEKYLNMKRKYILGDKRVLEGKELGRKAKNLFLEKNYIEAAELYYAAYQLDPFKYSYLESAAGSNYLAKNYKVSISQTKRVIDSFQTTNGKAEFILANNYIALDSLSLACKYLINANLKGHKGAQSLFKLYCKR